MTRRQRIADLTTFALPSQPALSPDGREVVYVLTTVDAAADKNVTSLWRAGAGVSTGAGPDGRRPEPRRLTRGEADSSPAWSPDGSKIAFLRADGGPAQLWLLAADGGEPEQVTTLPLGAGAPVWSPDGTRIAFGAPVDLRAVPGEDDAARAKRAAAPVVTTRLDYKADGAGLLRTMPQAPARPRPRERQGQPGDRGRLARGGPGLVARLGEAGVRRRDRARRGPELPRSRLRHRRVRPFAKPRARRARRRHRRARRAGHRTGPR